MARWLRQTDSIVLLSVRELMLLTPMPWRLVTEPRLPMYIRPPSGTMHRQRAITVRQWGLIRQLSGKLLPVVTVHRQRVITL